MKIDSETYIMPCLPFQAFPFPFIHCLSTSIEVPHLQPVLQVLRECSDEHILLRLLSNKLSYVGHFAHQQETYKQEIGLISTGMI